MAFLDKRKKEQTTQQNQGSGNTASSSSKQQKSAGGFARFVLERSRQEREQDIQRYGEQAQARRAAINGAIRYAQENRGKPINPVLISRDSNQTNKSKSAPLLMKLAEDTVSRNSASKNTFDNLQDQLAKFSNQRISSTTAAEMSAGINAAQREQNRRNKSLRSRVSNVIDYLQSYQAGDNAIRNNRYQGFGTDPARYSDRYYNSSEQLKQDAIAAAAADLKNPLNSTRLLESEQLAGMSKEERSNFDYLDSYKDMTDEEKNIYNYLYATEGVNAAEEFHNSILNSVNYRTAQSRYENDLRDRSTAYKTREQYLQGASEAVGNLFDIPSLVTGDTSMRPTTVGEYEAGMVANDPNNTAAQKAIYNMARSIGYMTPGIATGSDVVFALSQAGGSWRQAVNNGEGRGTAGLYALQQGIDESATNWLLGGINKFGGGAIQRVIGKAGSGIFTSVLDRVGMSEPGRAIISRVMDYVGDMTGEAAQEYLQYFTENWTQALLGMKDENGNQVKANFDFKNPEALYAAMLGALNSAFLNSSGFALGTYGDVSEARMLARAAATGATAPTNFGNASAIDTTDTAPQTTETFVPSTETLGTSTETAVPTTEDALMQLAEESVAREEEQKKAQYNQIAEAARTNPDALRQVTDGATMLSEAEKTDAILAGQQAANDDAMADLTKEISNGGQESRDNVYSAGPERLLGDSSGEPIEGSRGSQRTLGESWQTKATAFRDNEAKTLRIKEAQSAERVLKYASPEQTVYSVEGDTKETSNAKAIASAIGVKNHILYASEDGGIYVGGGRLSLVRGSYDSASDTITACVNNPNATSRQITSHETVHRAIARGNISANGILSSVKKANEDRWYDIDTLASIYMDWSNGDYDSELAMEELLCDIGGGINQFEKYADQGDEEAAEYAAVMRDVIEEVRPMLNDALDGALDATGEQGSTETSAREEKATGDVEAVSKSTDNRGIQYSTEQFANSLGFEIQYDEDGATWKIVDPETKKPIKHITPDQVKQTSMGCLIQAAVESGTVSEDIAKKQRKMFADLMNLTLKYDPASLPMVWEVSGSFLFSSVKTNSDAQYSTTVDYGTICSKTQALIDVLSNTMVEKGRGLTREEVITAYNKTANQGLSVPCPVCYVFSRWMGVPSLLDNMRRCQERFGNASEKYVQRYISDMLGKYGDAKAINSRKTSVQNRMATLEQKLQKANAENDLETKKAIRKETTELQRELDDLESFNWVTQVRCSSDGKGGYKLDPKYKSVPNEVLLDLRRSGDFASKYPKSWKYRTTRGAGMGKAIMPYSGATIGDFVKGNKDRWTASKNPFTLQNLKNAKAAIKRAITRAAAQNLIGGQRFQSTSDYRAEWGIDYLMTFLECQAAGSQVQLYTKVIEAVDMLASAGAECNLSIMPKDNGYIIKNGKEQLVFSDVTGINFDEALKKVKKYDNVQMILVGINDKHIKLALADDRITFVIPWHSSGNSKDTLAQLMSAVGETLDVSQNTDYSDSQTDKVIDNSAHMQRLRQFRKEILQGKLWENYGKRQAKTLTKEQRTLLNENAYLNDLYNRFYKDTSAQEYGVRLNGKQTSSIFPYEYWDKSLTYKDADQNGERFKEYCASLGIQPRFIQFANEHGYWKLLIDRKMYNNDGTYHTPKAIDVTNVKVSQIPLAVNSNNYKDMNKIDQATMDTLRALDGVKDDLSAVNNGDAEISYSSELNPSGYQFTNQGLREYSDEEKESISRNDKAVFCNNDQDVLNYISDMESKGFKSEKNAFLGDIGKDIADRIMNEAGVDVLDKALVLTKHGFDHALTHHGDMDTEAARNQIPITPQMFANVPYIVGDFDSVKLNDYGNLRFSKRYAEGEFVFDATVSNKRMTVKSEDMWLIKKASAPTLAHIPYGYGVAARGPGFSTNNIPQNPEAVQRITDDSVDAMMENGYTKKEAAEAVETGGVVHYSTRLEPPPKKTITAYKAFYAMDGKLYPPMVANDVETEQNKGKKKVSGTLKGLETPVGVWIDADVGRLAYGEDGKPLRNTKGRLAVKNDKGGGTLAFRPGWHLGLWPDAKQFNVKDPITGELKACMPDGLVFARCSVAADYDYQLEALGYGMKDNGKFDRTQAGLPRIPKNGYYMYRTNVDPTTAPWIITGAIKVEEILDDDMSAEICKRYGITADPRASHKKINLADHGLKAGPVTPTEDMDRFLPNDAVKANAAALEEALADKEFANAYVARSVNFDDPEIVKELARNKQNAAFYKEAQAKYGNKSYEVNNPNDPLIDKNTFAYSSQLVPNESELDDTFPDWREAFSAPGDDVYDITNSQSELIAAMKDNNQTVGAMASALGQVIGKSNNVDIAKESQTIAARIARRYGSKVDTTKLTGDIEQLLTGLQESTKRNVDEVEAAASNIGAEVLNGITQRDPYMDQNYKNLRKELRSYKLTLSEADRADIASAYDTYNNFRKKVFGRLTLVNSDTKGAIPVDTAYQELSEKYPDLFPEDITHPADQLIQMAEVARSFNAAKVSAVEGMDEYDYEMQSYMVGQDILKEYYSAAGETKFKSEYDAQIDALKNKYEQRIKNLRNQKNARIEQIKQGYRDRVEKARLKKLDSRARTYLLEKAKKLARMKGGPEFEAAKQELIGNLDLVAKGMRSDTKAKLEEFKKRAEALAEQDENYEKLYFKSAREVFSRLEKTHINDMTGQEVEELTTKVLELIYQEQTTKQMLNEAQGKMAATVARRAMSQQENVKGIDDRNIIRSFFGRWKLNMLNPTRAFQRIDGYQNNGVFTELGRQLNDGQTKMNTFVMNASKKFNGFLEDHPDLVKTWSKADIDTGFKDKAGKSVLISKGMRISLYLHSLNSEQNGRHIAEGGIKIPNAELYNRGLYRAAYRYGQELKLKPTDLAAITSQMTADERAFADIAHDFLNVDTKNAINETSLVLNGTMKAMVDNYFPIRSNPNFTMRDITGLVMDGTIEGMGMLKERVSGAMNQILLEDVAQVLQRQTNNTALYYGLAIPVRDFNKVMTFKEAGANESVSDSIEKAWGDAGLDYITDVLNQIQGGTPAENGPGARLFNSLKSTYAGTVLNWNLGVAMKQSASAPFAAVVLDAKSVARAMATNTFSKADYDYMDSITPWSYMRRQGMSGTEMGEVYKQKNAVQQNRAFQKFKEKTNFIQNVDVWTTDRLFFATEYYVQDHYPELKVRGTEYNKKVAEIYNDMLQRTQPSYDVMQRNAYLRSGNFLSKVFGMFKTQTFNMGGEIIDAAGRVRAYEQLRKDGRISENQLREAKAQFGKTVAATAVSQMMLAVLGVVAKAIMHNMKNYRDDKGEVTPESVAARGMYEFFTSFAGMGMGVNEFQSFLLSLSGKEKWYYIAYPGLSVANELASSSVDMSDAFRKAMENGWDDKSVANLKKKIGQFTMNAAIVGRIPAENLYNIANAMNLWFQDYKNGMLGTFDAGEGIWGIKNSSVTGAEYAKQALYEFEQGNEKRGEYALGNTKKEQLETALGAEGKKNENGDTISGSKQLDAISKINDLDMDDEYKVDIIQAMYPKLDTLKPDLIDEYIDIREVKSGGKQEDVANYLKKVKLSKESKIILWELAGYAVDSKKDGKVVKNGNYDKWMK